MLTEAITYYLPREFRTSAQVLSEVLNVPTSTIIHELQKQGYNIEYSSSFCIDEKMLEPFVVRFCKKVKKYFINSYANLDILTDEERSDLNNFIKVFSKDGIQAKSWRQIDKAKLRESLLHDILDKTYVELNKEIESERSLLQMILVSRRPCYRPVIDVKDIFNYRTNHLTENYPRNDVDNILMDPPFYTKEQSIQQIRIDSIKKITKSRYFRYRVQKPRCKHIILNQQRRIVYVFARYHIFATEDDNHITLSNSVA